MFHLVLVVLPDRPEAKAWVPIGNRIFATFGDADCRVAFLVPSTRPSLRKILDGAETKAMVFIDPDKEFVSSMGLERLPAFVHLRQTRHPRQRGRGMGRTRMAAGGPRNRQGHGVDVPGGEPVRVTRRRPPAGPPSPDQGLSVESPRGGRPRLGSGAARTSKDVRASCYRPTLMTTNPPPRRRSPRTLVRAAMLLCALGGVLITVLPATTASAAPIDDLRGGSRSDRGRDGRPSARSSARPTSRSRARSSKSIRRSKRSPTRKRASPPRRVKSRASPRWYANGPRASTRRPGSRASANST